MITPRSMACAVLALVAAAGCAPAESKFGRACTTHDDCVPDLLCVDAVCVPPRQPDDLGESCENPLPLERVGPDKLPLVGETAFYGARGQYPTSCDPEDNPGDDEELVLTDVVFSFALTRATALRVRAEANIEVTLSLRRLEDGACGDEVVDGCVQGSELQVARALPGSWVVIVRGQAKPGVVVGVTVEELGCPPGYLPFDDGQCAGFREVMPSNLPRAHAKLTALPDGRAILTGGIEAGDMGTSDAEVFDPATETWSYIGLTFVRRTHAAIVAGDTFLVLGGADKAEALTHQPDGSDLIAPMDYEMGSAVFGFEVTAELVSVGFPSGVLVAINDEDSRVVRVTRAVQECSADLECFVDCPDAICVVGTTGAPFDRGYCLSPLGPCLEAPEIHEAFVVWNDPPAGAASSAFPLVAAFRGQTELALLHGRDAVYELAVATGLWRAMPLAAAQQRPDVALTAIEVGALVSGGLLGDSDRASRRVEVIDVARREVVPRGELRDQRVGHAHTRVAGDRVLVAGGRRGNSRDDEQGLATAELIDPRGAPVPRLPRLPAPLASAVAATLADGRVLVVGGGPGPDALMSEAVLFEVVPAGSAVPDADLDAVCGLIVPIAPTDAAGADEVDAVRETTLGERDLYRDPTCGSEFQTHGPERSFSFSLPMSRAFHAQVTVPSAGTASDASALLILLQGDCEDHEALGCAARNDDTELGVESELFAPTLPPGDYLLVAEVHDEEGRGAAHRLQAWFSEPEACPLDDEDPADDQATGARRLEVDTPWYDADNAPSEFTSGTLCRGDVDHLIVEVWSPYSRLFLTNAPRSTSTLAPAIIDDGASVAADAPVYQWGTPAPFGDGMPGPGIFLWKLAVGDLDPLLHRWTAFHSQYNCAPDAVDSLAPILDDGNDPLSRVLLPFDQDVIRCATSAADTDVSVVAMPSGADARVALDDANATMVQVHALAAPSAPLGASLGEPIASGASVFVPAGTAPWLAVIATTTEGDAGGLYTLRVTPAVAGDACENALYLADSGSMPLDTTPHHDDLDPVDIGDCTGWAASGNDVVGVLTLRDRDRITATLDPLGTADVSLYLTTGCALETPACVVGADGGAAAATETITYTHTGPESQFYVVADAYSPGSFSASLSWTVTRAGQ